MKRVYTRTGDDGTTGIHGGERVPKDDIRIDANGCIDELNAQIGIVRSLLPPQDEWHEGLRRIQTGLMTVMSLVATPSAGRDRNPNVFDDEMDRFCERWMDRMTAGLQDSGYFLLPGGTPLAAQLQYARTVARRAERRMWTLHRKDPLPREILRFVNRLSDLFFVMARYELDRQNWPEERWRSFAYKNSEK
ncbi:MAG: cob(I)yrinic acid a,c-diamide adenosyltransferase [Bacteroidaceae bacterium]|nr:cob(I)yrinic acid a,c-diamide adenosyltransferase [Bacteroidaceae bacterium]